MQDFHDAVVKCGCDPLSMNQEFYESTFLPRWNAKMVRENVYPNVLEMICCAPIGMAINEIDCVPMDEILPFVKSLCTYLTTLCNFDYCFLTFAKHFATFVFVFDC